MNGTILSLFQFPPFDLKSIAPFDYLSSSQTANELIKNFRQLKYEKLILNQPRTFLKLEQPGIKNNLRKRVSEETVSSNHGQLIMPYFPPSRQKGTKKVTPDRGQNTVLVSRLVLHILNKFDWLYTTFIFLSSQILESMDLDSGIPLNELLVDGGMTINQFLMQLQSNILGINVGESFTFVQGTGKITGQMIRGALLELNEGLQNKRNKMLFNAGTNRNPISAIFNCFQQLSLQDIAFNCI